MDGNHRHEVFTINVKIDELCARLVCPVDRQGTLMTFDELALIQGCRNVQHGLTAPICLYFLHTFSNYLAPLETMMYIASNLPLFVVSNPTRQQLGGAAGAIIYNHQALLAKRKELVEKNSRAATLRTWMKLGV